MHNSLSGNINVTNFVGLVALLALGIFGNCAISIYFKIKEDIKKRKKYSLSKCASCGRSVVPGLSKYVNDFSYAYGPDDEKNQWERTQLETNDCVTFTCIAPKGKEVFGGICTRCDRAFCILCIEKGAHLRLVNASNKAKKMFSKKTDVRVGGTILESNGKMHCPKCKAYERTIEAL